MKTTETKMDYNSPVNQDIKGKLVGREVLANANQLAQFSINKSIDGDMDAPIQWDEIPMQYPEFYGEFAQFEGGTEEDQQEEIARLTEIKDEKEEAGDLANSGLIESEIKELLNLEPEHAEIYEWWIVTDHFANKLKDQGQIVLSDGHRPSYFPRSLH